MSLWKFCRRTVDLFLDQKTGVNFSKNYYLIDLLMSWPGLFHVKALYHLVINTSGQLTKKGHKKHLDNFGKNVKTLIKFKVLGSHLQI